MEPPRADAAGRPAGDPALIPTLIGCAPQSSTTSYPKRQSPRQPVEPRHASRLLDTRDLTDHTFIDLPGLLEPGDLIVVNASRVRRARLRGTREGSGGSVEALLLERVGERRFSALVRPARRLRSGSVVRFGTVEGTVLTDPVDGKVELEIGGSGDVEEAIETIGDVPLPPYIKHPIDDPARYQTIYADRPGSSAAPTAGLHVSTEVLAGLTAREIGVAAVDLEVGLDTFRPIATDDVGEHTIHRERYSDVRGHCCPDRSDQGGRGQGGGPRDHRGACPRDHRIAGWQGRCRGRAPPACSSCPGSPSG